MTLMDIKNEQNLLKVLACIEDYSKTLVCTSKKLMEQLKQHLDKSASGAISQLDEGSEACQSLSRILSNRVKEFTAITESAESLNQQLDQIDTLYDDVMRLSDMISALEQTLNCW